MSKPTIIIKTHFLDVATTTNEVECFLIKYGYSTRVGLVHGRMLNSLTIWEEYDKKRWYGNRRDYKGIGVIFIDGYYGAEYNKRWVIHVFGKDNLNKLVKLFNQYNNRINIEFEVVRHHEEEPTYYISPSG